MNEVAVYIGQQCGYLSILPFGDGESFLVQFVASLVSVTFSYYPIVSVERMQYVLIVQVTDIVWKDCSSSGPEYRNHAKNS